MGLAFSRTVICTSAEADLKFLPLSGLTVIFTVVVPTIPGITFRLNELLPTPSTETETTSGLELSILEGTILVDWSILKSSAWDFAGVYSKRSILYSSSSDSAVACPIFLSPSARRAGSLSSVPLSAKASCPSTVTNMQASNSTRIALHIHISLFFEIAVIILHASQKYCYYHARYTYKAYSLQRGVLEQHIGNERAFRCNNLLFNWINSAGCSRDFLPRYSLGSSMTVVRITPGSCSVMHEPL